MWADFSTCAWPEKKDSDIPWTYSFWHIQVSKSHTIIIMIIIYCCYSFNFSDNKTADMVAWGKRYNVKILDFPTIPHLTRENVQTNQRWDKWCEHILQCACNSTRALIFVCKCLVCTISMCNCKASGICSRYELSYVTRPHSPSP